MKWTGRFNYYINSYYCSSIPVCLATWEDTTFPGYVGTISQNPIVPCRTVFRNVTACIAIKPSSLMYVNRTFRIHFPYVYLYNVYSTAPFLSGSMGECEKQQKGGNETEHP